jgi:hypothetical protein
MASKQLIKQISIEKEWSQVEIQRAIDASPHAVNTRDEIINCMLHYGGKSFKKYRNEIGVFKRRDNQQKKMIGSLTDQLTKLSDFYDDFIPVLKSTIASQAASIADFVSDINKRGRK